MGEQARAGRQRHRRRREPGQLSAGARLTRCRLLGRGVERGQQLGEDEVELHLADAAVEVAHQAAALAVFGQPRAQGAVGGVEADQLEAAGRLRARILAEEEVGADQLGEVAEVGQALGRQQHRRVERAAEPHQAVEQRRPCVEASRNQASSSSTSLWRERSPEISRSA